MNEMEKTPQDKVTDRWFHFLYAVIWPFFNLFRPLKVIGRENIPDGAAVLCPNHTTIGDPFYVVFAFGRRYPMRAMAKIQIMRVPFIGWILGKGGVFGVDRGHADMHAVKTALKLLKDGNKLLMFPEGTRVREGEDVAAKTGAAMFATRSGVPLVPIYIQRKSGCSPGTQWSSASPITPSTPGASPRRRSWMPSPGT